MGIVPRKLLPAEWYENKQALQNAALRIQLLEDMIKSLRSDVNDLNVLRSELLDMYEEAGLEAGIMGEGARGGALDAELFGAMVSRAEFGPHHTE